VVTELERGDLSLQTRAEVVAEGGEALCTLQITARSRQPGWLVVALRPLNPEGISFINDVALSEDRLNWQIDDRTLGFSRPVVKHFVSEDRKSVVEGTSVE